MDPGNLIERAILKDNVNKYISDSMIRSSISTQRGVLCKREREIKFIGLFEDRGH